MARIKPFRRRILAEEISSGASERTLEEITQTNNGEVI
jgi:hypothetical protein